MKDPTQQLIEELKSLEQQERDTLAQLHKIEGAKVMVRHLLAKFNEQPCPEPCRGEAELVPSEGG
jgi:hypothetical protein